MNDSEVSRKIEDELFGMRRFTFVLVPLFVCACCLLISLLNLQVSVPVRMIASFLYGFWCFGVYNETFVYTSRRLIGDIEKWVNSEIIFHKSPRLPSNPPICNGYIYARQKNDEWSKPYEMKYSLREISEFTIDGRMRRLTGYLKINDQTFQYHGYNNLSNFKFEALRNFEERGFEIEAIMNDYGQYLWIKDTEFKHKNFYKTYKRTQINVLKILMFIAILSPIVWLLEPIFSTLR